MINGETHIPNDEVAKVFASMAVNLESGEIDWQDAPERVHAQVLDSVLGVSDSIIRSSDYHESTNLRSFPEPPPELLAHSRD